MKNTETAFEGMPALPSDGLWRGRNRRRWASAVRQRRNWKRAADRSQENTRSISENLSEKLMFALFLGECQDRLVGGRGGLRSGENEFEDWWEAIARVPVYFACSLRRGWSPKTKA
jgi:hypothetical protein